MELEFYTTSEQAWNAELAEIEKAKKTIDIESYIFLDDAIGKQFLNALKKKADEGVTVRCIFDAFGSILLSNKTIEWCKKNKINVELFHKIKGNKKRIPFWKKMLERNHRKTLIIDGLVAFVGGVNIEEAHRHWRDIQAKITNTQVATLQQTFNETWEYLQNGYFKRVRVRIKERVKKLEAKLNMNIWAHTPHQEEHSFRKLFKYIITNAKKDVLLITPYFFPSPVLLNYMKKAMRRGVHVRLLAPWVTDAMWTIPLMREYVRLAKKIGVDVRKAGEPLLHAKAFFIDGKWGVIGSANIYNKSLLFDRELSLIIGVGPTADNLKKILEGWWEQGTQLTEEMMHVSWKEYFLSTILKTIKRFI